MFSFPSFWFTDVTVLRSGGRDNKGNPLPVEEIEIGRCLFADKTSTEDMGFSDLIEADAALYRDPDDEFQFEHTDRIRIPDGARGSGEWSVAGRVQEWPYGVVVPLKLA